MKKINTLCLLFAVLVLSSCGGDSSSTTSPDLAIFPQVSGNYSGTVTFIMPEIGLTLLDCPASTVVTQSGSNVNIAPIIMTGPCGGQSVPFGASTIDSTGALPNESFTFSEDCGTYNAIASGGFFGRDFRFSINATSSTCFDIDISGVLSR